MSTGKILSRVIFPRNDATRGKNRLEKGEGTQEGTNKPFSIQNTKQLFKIWRVFSSDHHLDHHSSILSHMTRSIILN